MKTSAEGLWFYAFSEKHRHGSNIGTRHNVGTWHNVGPSFKAAGYDSSHRNLKKGEQMRRPSSCFV